MQMGNHLLYKAFMFYFYKRQSHNDPIGFLTFWLVSKRGFFCMLNTFVYLFTNPFFISKNLRSHLFVKRIGLISLLSVVLLQATVAQHSTRNNYSGAWEMPASWNPAWTSPLTNINGLDITIYGKITVNGSLSLDGNTNNLSVNDTLVVKGNLTTLNNYSITVKDAGILIVRGNLTISSDSRIIADGIVIVTGNIIKTGDINSGLFKSNDTPAKVFIGGSIPLGLTDNNSKFTALNCSLPDYPYPNSTCNYGNMTDLANASINSYFQTTCIAVTPTITASGNTTFCSGDSVMLTSSDATTYLWSNGATTKSISVSKAGIYTVQITDAGGCQSASSSPATVSVNAMPATPTISAGGPTTFCEGGNVTLTSVAGSTYQWSTGATTQSISVSAAGNYSVKVTNASGCMSAASTNAIITVYPLPPAPVITAGGPTIFCSGGSVDLTASAGSIYLWSNGESTKSINITTTGSYTVRVTNENGCQSAPSATTTVTANPLPPAPTITVGGPTSFCSGGSVTLTSSIGTSYLWSNGASTAAINVSSSGNYSVKVTSAFGCQSAASAVTSVIVNPLPAIPAITSGGPTSFCAGGNVNLTSGAGSSYLWSTGETTQSINVSTAGSYTVRVTNASGCQSAVSVATTVTVNPLPPAPVISTGGPTSFCAGGNVILTSSAGYAYSWSTGATSQSINVSAAGDYSVTIANANGCMSPGSTATTVSVNALPVVNAGADAAITSGNSKTINATVSGAGPFTYSWSPSALLVDAMIEDPTTINLTSTALFTITATSVATGCSNTSSVKVTVLGGALAADPIASPSTVCSGKPVQLEALAGQGSGIYYYTWTSIPAGFSSTIANPIANPTLTTTYSVVVFDGFNTVSKQVVVTVNPLPATPTITAGGPTTFCSGGSVTLTSSAGSEYLWSNGATAPSINVTGAGNYSVIVTNASGCQSASSTVTAVTVNPLPFAPIITSGGPTSFCAGGNTILTSSAGSMYLWSNGATTPSISVTSSGNYTVTTTSASGCQSAASTATTVTVNALPVAPTLTAGGPTIFCTGGSVTLTSGSGSTYLWSNGATTPDINITSSGSYTARITDANGCLSPSSAPTIVTVNALPFTPTITPGGPTTFCDGGSVTLTSSPGFTYLWSNGATGSSINITESGSYKVSITNASGCHSASSTATIVTKNALPFTPTLTAGGPTTFCEGGSVTLTSSPGTIYLWSNGAASQVLNITESGSYSVTITDANGCQSLVSTPAMVTVNPLPPTPVITSKGPTTFCEGGSVTLSSDISSIYLWSTGAITPDINVSTSGSYTVLVTDVNGCQSAVSVATDVTVNPLPVTPTITAGGATTFCAGNSVNLTSSFGSTYEWSNGAVSQTINVLESGDYTVIATNTFGCQSAESVPTIVTVNDLPAKPTITAGSSTTFCSGGSVVLTSTAGSAYLWSNGSTSPSIDVATSGSFTVSVSNANGCQSVPSAATVVTANPLPPAPAITASGQTTFCEGGSVTLSSEIATSYLWLNGETTSSIYVTSSGSYSALVTNIFGCQSELSPAFIVTVNPLPVTPTLTADGPITFCEDGSVILSSSTGTTYLWSDGATTQDINVTQSGSYSIMVTNDNGCQSEASTSTTITVNPLPAKPTVSADGPVSFCEGGNVTLNSSEGTAYEWSTGASTRQITITQSGNYSVRVTNENACQSEPSTVTVVNVNPLPPPPDITASGPTTFCEGGSVTLSASGGVGYSWSTGETVSSIKVSTAGNYSVIATDDKGCSSTAGVTIKTIKTEADAGMGGEVCGQSFILNATLKTGTGKWSLTSGAGNATFGPGENSPSAQVNVDEYGIYLLTWEVINENCPASSDVTVVFHPYPIADAGKDQILDYTFTSGMDARLESSQTGTWSLLSGSGSVQDIHSPVASISGLIVGKNIFLWEVNSAGCVASDTVSIEVYDLFVPQVITPNGDQKNDFFVIKGLEENSPAELIVIDRWGSEVYRYSNYSNDWDGKTTNGTELRGDTYFYVLKLANGRVTKGYLVIKR